MLIGKRNEEGSLRFTRIPDLPSDYTCAEWKAFDAAVDATGKVDLTDENQRRAYLAYHAAMQARADAGDYEDILGDEDEEAIEGPDRSESIQRKGFLGWLLG